MARGIRGVIPAFGVTLAACFGGSADSTTTSSAETTTAPTTTAATTTTTLVPNGTPIAQSGDRGEVVMAFQFLLNCTGFGPLDEDGVFGPASQGAVEQAQIALGRETTGAADEDMLRLLARDCGDGRRIPVADDVGVAFGNVALGDPDTYFVRSGDSGRLAVVAVADGAPVRVAVRSADGTALAGGAAAVAAGVADDEDHVVEVTTTGESATYRVFVATSAEPGGAIALAAHDTVVIDGDDEVVSSVCVDTTGSDAYVAEVASGHLVVASGSVGGFGRERGGIGAAIEFVFRDGSPGYHGYLEDFGVTVDDRIAGSGHLFRTDEGAAGDSRTLSFSFDRTAAPCGGGAATAIVLQATGLGVVDFGTDDTTTVSRVREALPGSSPVVDTGWTTIDPAANDIGVCRSDTTEIRVVQIDNLVLYFTDGATSWAASGGRHFAGYRATAGVFPLATAGGAGPGDTIEQVLAAHPDAVAAPGLLGGVDVFISSPPGWDRWLRASASLAVDPGDVSAEITAVIGGRFCDG